MGGDASRPLLIVGDRVRTGDPLRPTARAVLVEGARIAWVGDDPVDAPQQPGSEPVRLHLEGAEVHPGLVDAHAHLTATGLSLVGLDLTAARSAEDCLAGIRAIAGVTPGHVIWGSGWDEFDWPDRRRPTADELAAAGGGRPVFLSRADGHSAVLDRVSLELAPLGHCDGVERDARGHATGLVRREAMQIARRWFIAQLPAAQLSEARAAVASHLASLGVVCAHEMGGPDLMGLDDFDAWLDGSWPIDVVGYWGDLDLAGLQFVSDLRARGVAARTILTDRTTLERYP
jgi:predicted amidohydrolase YtcJ